MRTTAYLSIAVVVVLALCILIAGVAGDAPTKYYQLMDALKSMHP